MNTYEIEFTYEGSRYTEEVTAQNSNAANKLIRARYPGCSIWNTRKK